MTFQRRITWVHSHSQGFYEGTPSLLQWPGLVWTWTVHFSRHNLFVAQKKYLRFSMALYFEVKMYLKQSTRKAQGEKRKSRWGTTTKRLDSLPEPHWQFVCVCSLPPMLSSLCANTERHQFWCFKANLTIVLSVIARVKMKKYLRILITRQRYMRKYAESILNSTILSSKVSILWRKDFWFYRMSSIGPPISFHFMYTKGIQSQKKQTQSWPSPQKNTKQTVQEASISLPHSSWH